VRLALVDASPRSRLYPIALLKIGAWRRNEGDECELFLGRLPAPGLFDEIWLSTRFTYHVPFALGLVREAKKRASRVWVGGISATLMPEHFEREGVEVHRGLLAEAEDVVPDYSLLEELPDYCITYTSRGCVRRCGFCMVSRLEPEYRHRPDWERDLHANTRAIMFYDNNWLAKSHFELDQDVRTIRRLVEERRIREVDFNQGLDARLMNEQIADLLEGLPIRPVRFAFDGMQEDGYYQRAIELMAARGCRSFVSYVLYNFNDTAEDLYYRLRESVRLEEELGAIYGVRVSVSSFPMRFQPILQVDRRRAFIGPHWTERRRRGVMTIVSRHGKGDGIVSMRGGSIMTPMQEFEFWFGEDQEAFLKLLDYPRLDQLMARKKGYLRTRRAQHVTPDQWEPEMRMDG
jgi:hypothetical protein